MLDPDEARYHAPRSACPQCGSSTGADVLMTKVSSGEPAWSITLVRCPSCDLVRRREFGSDYDDELYSYYAKYDSADPADIYDSLTELSYQRVLAGLSAVTTIGRIVDVGCGKGDFVYAAQRLGYDVRGIDLADEALSVGRRFDLPVSKIDFLGSEIVDSSADLITMFEVVEHLPNPRAFLTRSEDVLRPGGVLYLTTPNYASLDRRVQGSAWRAIHPEHLVYFTPKSLAAMVSSHTGLEILRCETRNLEIETLKVLARRRRGAPESSSGEQGQAGVAGRGQFRRRIARSPILRTARDAANRVLNVTALGSTIVLVAKKTRGR